MDEQRISTKRKYKKIPNRFKSRPDRVEESISKLSQEYWNSSNQSSKKKQKNEKLKIA